MTMPLNELPDFWRAVQVNVRGAARDAAKGMADAYADHVRSVTLRRFSHPPGVWTTSPRYTGTPAWVTGDLSRSIRTREGAYTDSWAMASVGPYIIYGRIQELGGEIVPKRARWLHWQNTDPRTGMWTNWFFKKVEIPARPYLAPAARETIADGSLRRAAAAAFLGRVWI